MNAEKVHSFSCVPVHRLRLPDALLLGEVEKMLADGRAVMLKATGNSMLPFIAGGRDCVLLRRPSAELEPQVGRIALARLPDSRYVLHRIVCIDGAEAVLMGDGNLRETERCPLSAVVGIVVKIVRNGHSVDCTARLERCKAGGWRRLLPVRRYLLYLYKRIWG